MTASDPGHRRGFEGAVALCRTITAIAAVCRNGIIGDGADQPWSHPDDFARFKRLTRGGSLIMGRRTFQAIGRPLPGRLSVVLSRTPDWWPTGDDLRALNSTTDLVVVSSLGDAMSAADRRRPDASMFVVGGGEIYRAAWDITTHLEITAVDRECEGTVSFPDIDADEWRETAREPRTGFSWVSYERSDHLRPSSRRPGGL